MLQEKYLLPTVVYLFLIPNVYAEVPYLYDDGGFHYIDTDDRFPMTATAGNGSGYVYPYVLGVSDGSTVEFNGRNFLISTSGNLNSAIVVGGKGKTSSLTITGQVGGEAKIKSDSSAIILSSGSYGQDNKLFLDNVNITQEHIYSKNDAAIATYNGGGSSGSQTINIKNSIINFGRGIVANNAIVDLFNVVINASAGIGIIISQSDAKLKAEDIDITSMLSAIAGTAIGSGDAATFGYIDVINSKLTTLGNNASALELSAFTYPGNPPLSGPWIRDRVSLTDVNINTQGASSYGINMSNMNGSAKELNITTMGRSSFGVFISNNAALEMDSATINTDGTSAYAIYSYLSPRNDSSNLFGSVTANAKNAIIETHGIAAHGIVSNGYNINNGSYTAKVALNSSQLSTNGDSSYAIYSLNGGNTDVINSSLLTKGNGAYVAYAHGDAPTGATKISITDSKIGSSGVNSSLMLANQGGEISAEGVDGFSYGASAYALYSNTEQSKIHVKNSRLSTYGDKSGVFLGVNGSTFDASGLTANTFGNQSAGLVFTGQKTITTIDDMKFYGDYTNLASIYDSTFNLEQGIGIDIYGGDHTNILLNNTSVLSGSSLPRNERLSVVVSAQAVNLNENKLYNQSKDVRLNLTNKSLLDGSVYIKDSSYVEGLYFDDSKLIGNISLSPASILNNVILNNNSSWSGSALTVDKGNSISHVMIDNSSSWLISGGDSRVGDVVNNGKIIFAKPNTVLSHQNLTIDGDYTGGGYIVMNGFLRSDNSDSVVDSIKINGNVLGEPTHVKFLAADDLGMATKGNGINVIQAMQASTPTSFIQEGVISAGAYDYTLIAHNQEGVFTGNWYLTSEKNPTINPPNPEKPTDPVEPDKPVDPSIPVLPPKPEVVPPGPIIPPKPIDPPDPEIPHEPEPVKPSVSQNYRPVVVAASVVPSLANGVVLASLGSYQDRIAGSDKITDLNGTWIRTYGNENSIKHIKKGDMASRSRKFKKDGANYFRHISGLQIGQELSQLYARNGIHHIGLYFSQALAKADVDGIYTGDSKAGSVNMNSTSLGGYWTYQKDNGVYFDTQIQTSILTNIDACSSTNEHLHTHGWSGDFSLEAGYKNNLSSKFFLEPQLQTIFQHTEISEALSKNANLKVSYETANIIYNRLGVRIGAYVDDKSDTVFYSRLNYWNTMNGHSNAIYTNANGNKKTQTKLGSELGGDWYQAGIGLNSMLSHKTALYASLDYEQQVGSNSGHGVSGVAGIKIEW